MKAMLSNLRENPLKDIAGYKVVKIRDYSNDTILDVESGKVEPTGLPASNVLYYELEGGAWQMIFGVNTIPAYRKHGYAGELLKCAIEDARKHGRKGLVLTCKDHLVHYYAKFGFENEGVSESEHGGVRWNQMRLKF